MLLCKTSNQLKNYTKLLQNLKNEDYTHFSQIDNIWGADPADMQLIRKFNKGFQFLSYVVDIYSKYTWVVPLKEKKGNTITNDFQKNLTKSNCKPNKIWVDKGTESYKKLMKSWLQDNDIEIYSRHNEG